MASHKADSLQPRWQQIDLILCLAMSRGQHRRAALLLFRAASWLGDGIVWYGLAVALPLLYGAAALPVVGRLAAVGVVAALVSHWLKRRTARPRPFQTHAAIARGARALDEFSFPSGHTLHAVAFTILGVAAFPALGWILVPFAVLVALPRVVLGLHYPSDVLAGAAVGATLAGLALALS